MISIKKLNILSLFDFIFIIYFYFLSLYIFMFFILRKIKLENSNKNEYSILVSVKVSFIRSFILILKLNLCIFITQQHLIKMKTCLNTKQELMLIIKNS